MKNLKTVWWYDPERKWEYIFVLSEWHSNDGLVITDKQIFAAGHPTPAEAAAPNR